MEYQRGLNNSFGVSHVAHLGASPDSPATYEFSANYSHDKVMIESKACADECKLMYFAAFVAFANIS